MFRFITFVLLALFTRLSWSADLVVSTQPIYLIAKEITKGVEKPTLLLSNQTGHDVSLTPQHRKILQDAALVVWLGREHEAPLEKLLATETKAVALLDSGILQTFPQRNTRGGALKDTVDTHVWLDPNNAVRIGFFIAALRSQQMPTHREIYWNNAKNFAQHMLLTAKKYSHTSIGRPYWAYHDAYQYLERPLNLHFAGALTDDPHIGATVAQIKYLNDNRPYRQMCLLAEAHAGKSQYQKLGAVLFEKVDESMSQEENFVEAWQKLAEKTHNCVLSTQK